MKDFNRLAKALAYRIITGDVKHLHAKTVEAIKPYIIKVYEAGGETREVIDLEGSIIASRSRLYKAHLYLVEKGFVYNRHHAPRKIIYVNQQGVYAHTGSKGKVFINNLQITQFFNGVKWNRY